MKRKCPIHDIDMYEVEKASEDFEQKLVLYIEYRCAKCEELWVYIPNSDELLPKSEYAKRFPF